MPPHTFKFVAPAQVLAAWDVSRSFLWRMEKAGLIKPVYLFSRKLYSVEDVERVEKMISSGELRSELRGAARKNADKPCSNSSGHKTTTPSKTHHTEIKQEHP